MSIENIKTKALGNNAKEQMYTALQTIVKEYPYLYSNFLLEGSRIFMSDRRFVLGYDARVSESGKDYFNIQLQILSNQEGKSFFALSVNTSMSFKNSETGKWESKSYKPRHFNFDSEGMYQALNTVIEYLLENGIDIKKSEGGNFDIGYVLSKIKGTVLKTSQGVELNSSNKLITLGDNHDIKSRGTTGVEVTVYGGLGDANDMGDLVTKEFSIEMISSGSEVYVSQKKSTVYKENYPFPKFPYLQRMPLGDVHNLIANEYINSRSITYAEKTGSICFTDSALNGVSHGLLGLKDSITRITLGRDQNGYRLTSDVQYAPEELGGKVLKLRAEVLNSEKSVVVNTTVENRQTGATSTQEPVKYSYKQMNSEMNRDILGKALEDSATVSHLLSKATASKRMITNFLNTVAKQSETLVASGLGVIDITCSITKCKGRLPLGLEKYLNEDGYVADITIRGVHRNSQFNVKLMLSATKTKDIYYVSEVVSPAISAEFELSHFNVYHELNTALQETLETILGL